MRRILATGIIMVVIGLVCPMAYGEESKSDSSESDKWEFSITPYLWAVGLNGDMTVHGQDADVDESFSDILDNLDIALEAHVEAWRGNWGGFFDGTYVKLKANGDDGPVNVNITNTIGLIDFGGLYRIGRWPLGKQPAGAHNTGRFVGLEALVGGRYTDLKVKLDPQRLESRDKSKSWTDLIVGGRLLLDFTEKWSIILRGDIGGFGISGSSDFTANASGLVGWTFHPNWTLLGGYRGLYQDYETGSGDNKFKYDIWTHGPILGLTYAW